MPYQHLRGPGLAASGSEETCIKINVSKNVPLVTLLMVNTRRVTTFNHILFNDFASMAALL